MGKKNKTISINEQLFERLEKINASALIEKLLNDHFSMLVIKEASIQELEGREKGLKEQLKEIETKKVVIANKAGLYKQLEEYGIKDARLIHQLMKMNNEPSIHTAGHLRDEFNLNSATLVFKAWRIIHGEEEEEKDEKRL